MMVVDSPKDVSGQILASDLDGTLIPLAGDEQNLADLETLRTGLERNGATLVFSSGRHFESVRQAISEYRLPLPDWIICDVGTSIFKHTASGDFEPVTDYQQHQEKIVAALPIRALRDHLRSIGGLRLQEEEKQGRFKLSYYTDADELDKLVEHIQLELNRTDAPYSIIHSVDPFNGDGLIDLLPATVSKAHALEWWVEHAGLSPSAIVFAGDSGNDLAALTAGYRAIVVGNADREVARRAELAHQENGWQDRLYLAKGQATSGVLEGCRRFGLV